MEFTEYLAVLRRHWRIWVGCTAVAEGGTGSDVCDAEYRSECE